MEKLSFRIRPKADLQVAIGRASAYVSSRLSRAITIGYESGQESFVRPQLSQLPRHGTKQIYGVEIQFPHPATFRYGAQSYINATLGDCHLEASAITG